jgi:exonuclease SbcC
MRILAIRGKNLASLRGEFAIELNQPPLEQAGLFAITGHTGAGKSTLLDALCLALFDKIPRLVGSVNVKVGHVDEDEKLRIGSGDVASILSRGTAHAYAQVDFLGTDKKNYQAHWEIKRARNKIDGRIQKQTMSLKNLLTDELIGQNKSDTLAEISDRIGLTFEQFRRSVLLAQGDFAAFLKARTDERSALLERMTGTEIYSQLSRTAWDRFQQENNSLNVLQEQLTFDLPLEKPLRQELEQHQKALQKQIERLQKELEYKNQYLDWQKSKLILEQESQQSQQLLQRLKQRKQDEKSDYDHFQAVVAVKPLKPLYERLDQFNLNQAALEKQIAENELQQSRCDSEQQQLAEKSNFLFQQLQKSELEYEQKKPVILEARDLETRISLLENDCQKKTQSRSALNDEIQSIEQKRLDIAELQQQLSVITEKTAQLELELTQAQQRKKDLDHNTIQEQKNALIIKQETIKSSRDLLLRHQQIAKTLEAGDSQLQQLQQQLQETLKHIEQVHEQLHTLQISKNEAQRAFLLMQESVSKDINALRDSLTNGKPCPVCGATEHPWSGQTSQLNKQYQQQKQRVESLEQSLLLQQTQLQDLQQTQKLSAHEIKQLTQKLDELKLEHEEQQQQWQALQLKTELQINLSEASLATLDSALTTIDKQLSVLQQQEKHWLQIQADIEQYQAQKNSFLLQEKALNQQVTEQQFVVNQLEQLQKQRHQLDIELNQKQQEQQNSLNRKLQLLGNNTASEFEQGFQEAIEQLKLQVESNRSQRETNNQLQIKLKQNSVHFQQQKKEQLLEINRLHQTINELQAELNIDDARCRELLLRDEQWIKNQQVYFDELNKQILQTEAQLAERNSKLNQHKQQYERFESLIPEQWLSDSMAVKQQNQQTLVIHLQALNQSHQDLRVQIKQDDEKRERSRHLESQLQVQQEKTLQWSALNDLIGSASGQKFRIFAQSLTLESLLAHANVHLNDFARRYQLQRVPGSDLDIQVIDRDMADEIRSVQSLSGGESFLVSLALALGLASLSSSKTQVESLFIDEGFGTLDQETLDTAIASLDTLQSMGRKVGIISHVPILVERIGTRIVVEKLGGGKSRILIKA